MEGILLIKLDGRTWVIPTQVVDVFVRPRFVGTISIPKPKLDTPKNGGNFPCKERPREHFGNEGEIVNISVVLIL